MSQPPIKSLHLISDLIGLFRTHTVLGLFFFVFLFILILLFIFVLSLLIRIRWQNEREDERECVWQKSQPGRACELVVPSFFHFFFLILTSSRSSVHSAIYTVPALSCLYSSISRGAAMRIAGTGKGNGASTSNSFLIQSRQMILSSTLFYFNERNPRRYYTLSALPIYHD